jgi:SH3-like domain-containing protein
VTIASHPTGCKTLSGKVLLLKTGTYRRERRPHQLLMNGPALAICITAVVSVMSAMPGKAAQQKRPSFFSLKSNPINLRKGPGVQYPKAWVFRREGLPVQILRKHGHWRQVRDSDGATGWILRTLISRRRTALVAPWQLKEPTAKARGTLIVMHSSARRRSRIVAKLEAGTLVSLKSCDGAWCHVSIGRFRGYVRQEQLWGVSPQEILR